MFKHILSVGGFTLLSRLTGFVRDVVMAAVMGTGLVADAFVVAQRLPNHFRAIFGEGAFNTAFVPSYSAALEQRGPLAANLLAGRLLTVMTVILTLFSAACMLFMPQVVSLLAPGFPDEPEKFALSVALTRITFPYLLFITLVTLLSGVLNAHERFAVAAFAPVLLNVAMVAALAVSFLFPSAGYAAAWGLTASGVLQLILVAWDAKRHGILPGFRRPVKDRDLTVFWKALGPAVVGSAGVQIAMFADTVIASLLPTGAVSSLYYADRLYQLPVGVIGIAAGTVVLPTMSRRLAAGDEAGAHAAQNRAASFALVLSAPFAVAFILVPDLVMRGLFMRGAFDEQSAAASGAVLAAYAVGLPAVVLIRSTVAAFFARHDTATPLIASFSGIGVNLLLKLALFSSMGAAGLAFATAVGAWVNVTLLFILAWRRHWIAPDKALGGAATAACAGSVALALAVLLLDGSIGRSAATLPAFRTEAHLVALGLAGAVVYGAVTLAGLRVLRVPFRRI